MLKKILLPILIFGSVFVLTGCGHYWGCGSGHYHGHDHDRDHNHYQGCGHPGYKG